MLLGEHVEAERGSVELVGQIHLSLFPQWMPGTQETEERAIRQTLDQLLYG